MEIPDLIGVQVELPSTLVLTYPDGQVRRIDCTQYLDRGVFIRLKDPMLFAQAHVAHGTVCWPGSLDIAPETLYLRSVPVPSNLPTSTAT